MNNENFDVDAYLGRVGIKSTIPLTADGLESLHRAQAYTIPFENFDIISGHEILLDPESLFNKMVVHQRGGYCFELNGLFLEVLQSLGFQCRPLLARAHIRGTPGSQTHQLTQVVINDQAWIADVGFGHNGLRAPIPFEIGTIHKQDGFRYRLVNADPWGTMLQLLQGDDWINLYSLDATHVCPVDIVMGNHFSSTHPSSFFTTSRMAAIPKPNGMTTLLNYKLKDIEDNNKTETTIQAGQPYLDMLYNSFGITIPSTQKFL
jgi:N-hydroxyarylamine O-acetyltransferase